ncbi:MFS transporter [Methanorbis furvi]|uniref:Fosmidomycin resistance protein n=1 Tax=Methanorbis furvi TaxID=3028299 RepID=A0AAE4SAU6_9EURY|nr:Fosmidomycin resistance protein [Methanocorpusculaceae archaeon Ag1]
MNELAKRISVLAAGHGAVDFYLPVISASLPVLIPVFASQGITSYAMAGFLVTAITLTLAVVQPLAGWLQDNGKWTIGASWSVLMTAVAISMFAFIQNYWILLILAVVAGIGNSMFHPNAYQQIYQFSTPANRGTLLSLFSVGGSFGYGAAPLVAGALLVWAGLPGLIYLIIPGIIVTAILFRFPQKPELVKKEDRAAASGTSTGWRRAGMMLGISSMRTWVYYGFLAFATVYLTTYAGIPYFYATLFVTGMFYAGMIATLVAGFSSDRFGRKEILLISYACSIPAYLGIFLLPAPLSLVSLLAAGFFLMAPATIEIATVQEMMPGSVGFASGIVIGIPQALSAVSIVVIGALADSIGMPTALTWQVVFMGLAVVCCFALPYPMKYFRRKVLSK